MVSVLMSVANPQMESATGVGWHAESRKRNTVPDSYGIENRGAGNDLIKSGQFGKQLFPRTRLTRFQLVTVGLCIGLNAACWVNYITRTNAV